MRPISVLFTNNALAQRGGSETYVRDVALALLRRGHRPAVFSLVHGDIAAELRRATIPVIDDVRRLGAAPDVIHGHHHLETLIAALAFPDVPVVNFCHGWVPWEEIPLRHPAVRRYVAVDEVCLDRLTREEGIPPGQVELLLNFVDLQRFRARAPLPTRPGRAVIMSNAARPDGYAGVIRTACEAAGITVDIVGAAAGNATAAPEVVLKNYDLVFAKGRTALEALAVGCATVLADTAGAGPLVAPDNYEVLRARNFGIRELRQTHEAAWYRAQIAGYDAEMSARISGRVRAEAGMEPAVTRLLEIYASAMTGSHHPGDASRAAAVHCSRIAMPLKQAHRLASELERAAADLERVRAEAVAQAAVAAQQASASRMLQAEVDMLVAAAIGQEQQMQHAERQHAAAVAGQDVALRALQTQVDALRIDASRRAQQMQDAESEHAAAARDQAIASNGLQAQVDRLLADATHHDREVGRAEAQLASVQSQVRTLEERIEAFCALPTLRLRDAVLQAPGLGVMLQRAARRLARGLPSLASRAHRPPIQ